MTAHAEDQTTAPKSRAQIAADEKFPDTEWTHRATTLAFREAFQTGFEAGEGELAEANRKLAAILTMVDSYSWHPHDKAWIEDIRRTATTDPK